MAETHFGLRLKELRAQAGLTQEELAKAAGLGKTTVADLEQSRYDPTWPTVLELCRALGVDCLAFVQPPSITEKSPVGRPPKQPAKPRRRKGRGPQNG